MCNTDFHHKVDPQLAELPAEALADPALFAAVKGHPYGDECCMLNHLDGVAYWKNDQIRTAQAGKADGARQKYDLEGKPRPW